MIVIRTPDQRLRILISSTMKELASARAAARAPIEQLRLIPVLFELGARPYPPRDLYLAYLRQSDVFSGIYGQQYGWIAPDQEISGPGRRVPQRQWYAEARLRAVARAGPRSAAQGNAQPHPVGRIVLSRLRHQRRARHADRGRPRGAAQRAVRSRGRAARGRATKPPAAGPASRFIGREREKSIVRDLLTGTDARLVTLVGAGGIGKTRLALEVA